MPRTNTTAQTTFTRPDSVTYTLPSPPYSTPIVTISLPPGSTWTSGLHWHETHTEFLQVIEGAAHVILNRLTKVYTPSDGIIVIPRFAKHEWRRARDDHTELVVNEWTDPADGDKEVFFRNLSSMIADCMKEGPPVEWWLMLQLFVVFTGLDNFPVVLNLGYLLLGRF